MKSKKPYSLRQKSLKIAELIGKKQAKDIVILDVRKISGLCDYFVICSAGSSAQAEAILETVLKESKKNEIRIQHYESDELFHWVLIDFFDIILHIFLEEVRGFYNLEYLWSSAKKLKINSPSSK